MVLMKNMFNNYAYKFTMVVSCMFSMVQCTHFRGSMISWRVVNESTSDVTLEIFQRHAWRYNVYAPFCTLDTIANGQPILGASSYEINCVSTCPTGLTMLGNVLVPCTGYNMDEGYAMGEGRFTIDILKNVSFVATFSSAAWFNLVTGVGLGWSVAVQIQTFKRADTQWYNNAPVITMLPIYRLRSSVSYSIKINIADNDFDPYICLWCEGTDQCGGLVNSVPGGVIDSFGCYLNFTSNVIGYYAVALMAEDFIVLPTNISSNAYLSQVPIQFVLHVYDSSSPCYDGPVFVGDLKSDMCIYLSVGDTYTTRIRLQVQCPNASVASIISVNPTGLLTTPIEVDSFDPTIFAYLVTFTASAEQIGQNLFCFSGVDSIGNQGTSSCLRFTVSSETSTLQPLYRLNVTRYPTGTVSKTQSLWTLFTTSRTYQRPTTETYIRFKRSSDDTDYYVLNAVTAIDRVHFLSDRLIINSTVVWTPGEHFYIYFDAGVFADISTCTKDSMPISDPQFWPFDVPYESTTTSTTSTSETTATTTTTMRTTPTRRTLPTSTTSTTQSTTTTTKTTTTTTALTTTTKYPTASSLSIGAIVSITIIALLISAMLMWIVLSICRVFLLAYLLLKVGLRQQLLTPDSNSTPNLFYNLTNTHGSMPILQYKIATNHRSIQNSLNYSALNQKPVYKHTLVEIQM